MRFLNWIAEERRTGTLVISIGIGFCLVMTVLMVVLAVVAVAAR